MVSSGDANESVAAAACKRLNACLIIPPSAGDPHKLRHKDLTLARVQSLERDLPNDRLKIQTCNPDESAAAGVGVTDTWLWFSSFS